MSAQRETLDTRNSSAAPAAVGGSLADDVNGWTGLTERFNDPCVFYENKTVLYDPAAPYPKKRTPYVPANSDMTTLAAFCWELDPGNAPTQPVTADTLKKKYGELKSLVNTSFDSFEKSGHHGSVDDDDEDWLRCALLGEFASIVACTHKYSLNTTK